MGGVSHIDDDSSLLRRVHPSQIVRDMAGQPRVSSGAFKDVDMSVDVEELLAGAGLDWHFSLKDHPHHSLVRLPASAARSNGQTVLHVPLADNPAHAEV